MKTTSTTVTKSSASPSILGCNSVKHLYQIIRLKWRLTLYPIFCRIFAILLAFSSAMIIWSELTMAIDSMQSPVGMLLVHLSSGGGSVFVVQCFAFFALAYMSICTYWAMFRMNLGWAFTLQPNQQSPATSLLFNATYFCRLQFSLAFNFLLMLNNGDR